MPHDATPAAETAIAKILNDASGLELQELDRRASFLELGFDSLFLIQFTQKIKNQLKVKLTFRQLIEEIPTIDALVDFVARHSPAHVLGVQAPLAEHSDSIEESSPNLGGTVRPAAMPAVAAATPPPSPSASVTEHAAHDPIANSSIASSSTQQAAPEVEGAPTHAPHPSTAQPVAVPQSPLSYSQEQPLLSTGQLQPTSPLSRSGAAGLEQIITQQNQLMALQLQLLSNQRLASVSPSSTESHVPADLTAPNSTALPSAAQPTASPPSASHLQNVALKNGVQAASTDVVQATSSTANPPAASLPAAKPTFQRFGPYKPVRKSSSGGLTDRQQHSLDGFMQRFIAKTGRSRTHAQKHRPHFADPRGVAGYRRVWKSIVYQISVERSAESKLWDIDGNEYIDIAMGFGLNLFGQSPEFVTAALHQQLDRGVEVGPQSPLAGEVAELLCAFSRKDRVTFCNTGSEAVMAAMRLARTVTGKSKIVFFNKDYHGNFEEVLLRSNVVGDRRRTQPAAPGVPQSFADNAIVLDYGTPEALQAIREHAGEIAGVLVEPVQSADPQNQPREFLQTLRQLTREHDIALIMDEVISGFRAAQGGAQEWFGVWGDMATYGKVLGGGLPIGALAGSARFMDALDGGAWKYEDDSEPTADMTFFAGTFVRHPLAMTAAHQILMKVKEEGPELQQELTRKTSRLVDELNQFFIDELFPFRVAQFTSLFRFMFPPDLEYADLLYFHLLERGIFTRGWGDNCFLSTAHSDDDVQRIVEAVKSSCREIRDGGFMPKAERATHASARQSNSHSPSAVAPPATSSAIDSPTPSSTERSTAESFTDSTCCESATATTTATAIATKQQSLGLLHAPVPHEIADRADRISTLEEIQSEGDLPPLFCMPAADGLSLVYHHLAEELGDDQPVYGLTSPGVYGEEIPLTIEEMSQRFVEDIREQFPHGPYLLMGYCSGGTLAFEAAQQLVAAGQQVAFVAGIETYDWGTAQSSRPTPLIKAYYNLQRFEFHLRNFLLLKPRDQWSFLKSKLQRAKTRSKNWRGMLAGMFTKQRAVSATGAVNMHELWRLHDAQADRYRPRPYAGKLLLIRPRKDYRSYIGKQDLVATEGVTIVRVPAFPAGLMTPPYVSQVAVLVKQAIRDGLDRIDWPQSSDNAPRIQARWHAQQESERVTA